jgi:uncharacterized damage-inducible protein DinB
MVIALLRSKNMKTKELLVMHAKHNKNANSAVYGLLDKLSNDEREKDRGSYYKSLSALARHILGGTLFFSSLLKPAVPQNAAAAQAFSKLDGVKIPEGPLSPEQWKTLKSAMETVDGALVALVSALGETDFDLEANVPIFGGNPASVPLYFLLEMLSTHGAHHRGQISQILDELKIDNNFSGIDVALLKSTAAPAAAPPS